MSAASQFLGRTRVWASGTTYVIGDVLLSPADNYQQYVRITSGAGATDPSSDTTNYRPYGARAIKSTQRGVISMSSGGASVATATITSVATAKTQLRLLGIRTLGSGSGVVDSVLCTLVLTNSTTVTAERRSGSPADVAISWELTEFF